MNTIETIPFMLTENAIKEIKNIIVKENDSQKYLRIGVKGGGCSGLSYILELDYEKEGDLKFEIDNKFSVIVNPSHLIYLNNMEIDYSDGLNARGFTFKNPNATKTCGCGSSFAV